MSSCPFLPPAHFSSPLEEEFTIRASGAPCPMQAKPGPQPHLICSRHRLQSNDWNMIRWMCIVTTKDQANSQNLLERMQLHMLRSQWSATQMDRFGGHQSPYILVHFRWNVIRNGSYNISSSLQLGFKQCISTDFGNRRCLTVLNKTGWITTWGLLSWLAEGRGIGWIPYRWVSFGDEPVITHEACLVPAFLTR